MLRFTCGMDAKTSFERRRVPDRRRVTGGGSEMFRHVEQQRYSSRCDRRHEMRRVTDLLKTGRLRAIALAAFTRLDVAAQGHDAAPRKRRMRQSDPESD